MKINSKKNKHMTLEDRIEIQECQSKGMTFKAISQRINKDPKTHQVLDILPKRTNYELSTYFSLYNKKRD